MSTLGFLQQPGVEGLGEAGEDPYDFKEGDIEYSFPTTKRLKSRDPSRKSKVRGCVCGVRQGLRCRPLVEQ